LPQSAFTSWADLKLAAHYDGRKQLVRLFNQSRLYTIILQQKGSRDTILKAFHLIKIRGIEIPPDDTVAIRGQGKEIKTPPDNSRHLSAEPVLGERISPEGN
jgi:hypothetical protein